MLCRCRECLKQIEGNLTNIYSHLEDKHRVYVDTIHDAEKFVCFPWSDDAIVNGILVPENIKRLAKKLQYIKFFGGNYECLCCHKSMSEGFEFLYKGKPQYLVCNDCIHLEIGVMIGDIVEVEEVCNGKTMSISIQKGMAENGCLTVTQDSPFGKGLLGKKIGDMVEIETPRRKLQLHIISIR